jgi:ribosomal protein S25
MPQKRSLKQIEKQQRRKDRDDKEDKGGRVEKTIGSLDIPDMNSEELMEQLGKMKAITPTSLAVQLNVKVSTSKKLLEELRKDRVVDMVSRSHNLKVYALVAD